MKLIANAKYFFEPDFNGNLGLPASERLAVEIIRPKAGERGGLSATIVEKGIDGKSLTARTSFDVQRILAKHVGEIKNLELEDAATGEVKKVRSGGELAGAAFYGSARLTDLIVSEVCSDELREDEKKSLR